MATYRYVCEAVVKALKQNFDDADIPLALVNFWVTSTANRLRYLHLKKQDPKNGTFLSIFDNVPVLTSAISQPPDLVADRKYFDLPESIVELEYDQGVDFISHVVDVGCCGTPAWTVVLFQRTAPSIAHRLYMNDFEKPSSTNPYFYVVGGRVYLLGVECVVVRELEVGLYTNFSPNIECDLDKKVPLPEHLIENLIAQTLTLGRFMFASPRDRENEGTDTATDKEQLDGRTVQRPRAAQEVNEAEEAQAQNV